MAREITLPSISKIDLSDGIRITGSTLPDFNLSVKRFPVGTIPEVEAGINALLKTNYAVRTSLLSLSKDDPLRKLSPILATKQEIVDSEVVTTRMFAEIHIFSLKPLEYTVICSDAPIQNDWWAAINDKGD